MSPEFISTIAILSVFGLFAAFGATSFASSSKKVNKRNEEEDVMNDSKVTLVLYPEQAEQLLKEHPEQANNLRPDDNGDHFFLEYTPDIDDFVKENPQDKQIITIEHNGQLYDVEVTQEEALQLMKDLNEELDALDDIEDLLDNIEKKYGGKARRRRGHSLRKVNKRKKTAKTILRRMKTKTRRIK